MAAGAVGEHLRAYLAAVGSLPGGEFRDDEGVALCTAPIGWPMFNGVLASAGASGHAAERAIAEVAASGRPWFLWELPDTPAAAVEAAKTAGAEMFDDRAPWVEARIADLPDIEVPEGVTVEEVRDEAGHRTWARTLREIYEFPEAGEEAWTAPGELCGWSDLPWRQWIARLDGEPAGVTLLFSGGGVAGLFGVGTMPAARRRGIGGLVTLLPLRESGEEVAGFFATPDGLGLYDALGFRRSGWVTRHLGGSLANAGGLDRARG